VIAKNVVITIECKAADQKADSVCYVYEIIMHFSSNSRKYGYLCDSLWPDILEKTF